MLHATLAVRTRAHLRDNNAFHGSSRPSRPVGDGFHVGISTQDMATGKARHGVRVTEAGEYEA